jgi:hypothetical protein
VLKAIDSPEVMARNEVFFAFLSDVISLCVNMASNIHPLTIVGLDHEPVTLALGTASCPFTVEAKVFLTQGEPVAFVHLSGIEVDHRAVHGCTVLCKGHVEDTVILLLEVGLLLELGSPPGIVVVPRSRVNLFGPRVTTLDEPCSVRELNDSQS